MAVHNTERNLEAFLTTLFWMKGYATEIVLCAMFRLSKPTLRKWLFNYIKMIKKLWVPQNLADTFHPDQIYIGTVDGVHCQVYELQHPDFLFDRKYCSHKHGLAGVSYELMISLHEQRLLWINGPFHARRNDLSIYRSGLEQHVPVEKFLIADSGYEGGERIIIPNTAFNSAKTNRFKHRARAQHESFDGRLKNFAILLGCFCHRPEMAK